MHGNDTLGRHDADPVLSQAMSQVLEKVRELRKSILEAAVSDEHSWFRNLLLGILNCALLDYESVEAGVQKSICLAAWGSRNLLELKVIATYVLASEKNANDFKSDLLIDAKEFYEAVTKSHEATHTRLLSMMSEAAEQEEGLMKEVFAEASQREAERGPQTQASDTEAAMYRQIMSEFGLTKNAKSKRASQIARLIQAEADFDPMFKICSKIMHRTALSIASRNIRGSLDAAIPLLSYRSASDLVSIWDSIKKYIEEKGLRPPEN
jgi:hypothetical protein